MRPCPSKLMSVTIPLAAEIGAQALYLLFVWLAAAIVGTYLSERKGYGPKAGLASGLLLTFVGAIIWFFIPAREGSAWKRDGFRPKKATRTPGSSDPAVTPVSPPPSA